MLLDVPKRMGRDVASGVGAKFVIISSETPTRKAHVPDIRARSRMGPKTEITESSLSDRWRDKDDPLVDRKTSTSALWSVVYEEGYATKKTRNDVRHAMKMNKNGMN